MKYLGIFLLLVAVAAVTHAEDQRSATRGAGGASDKSVRYANPNPKREWRSVETTRNTGQSHSDLQRSVPDDSGKASDKSVRYALPQRDPGFGRSTRHTLYQSTRSVPDGSGKTSSPSVRYAASEPKVIRHSGIKRNGKDIRSVPDGSGKTSENSVRTIPETRSPGINTRMQELRSKLKW